MIFFDRIFKRTKINTAIHKDYKRLIERVAIIDGRDLYMFTNLLDMPHNRYNKCTRFSTEFNMRLDANTLKVALKKCLESANKGNFTNVISILSVLNEQTEMLISVEASYRLASCVYFWENEDLTDYDYEIGDDKIRKFRKIKFDDFFLNAPMNNFLPQMNLSAADIESYLVYEKELKNLTLQQLKDKSEQKSKMTT